MPAILGTTRVLGVIGHPVRHSFSPPMQNAAIEALGLDYVYVAFEIPPADLATALAGLRAAGVVGLNATIPHKEALLELVDVATPEAELTGTVNTVHFDGDRVVGDSTDGPGFVAGLDAAGCDVAGCRAVLLGAGGSARAVSVALLRRGVGRLRVANRTPARAATLVELLEHRVRPGVAATLGWDEPALTEELAAADLIVNTTSVGMHPRPDEQPRELPELKPGSYVVDIIYNPLRTRFLQQAEERGARCLNGVAMLVHQGALSLRRWTGVEPPVERMRAVLQAELERRARVS
jgi:shikimate dehydrogenase